MSFLGQIFTAYKCSDERVNQLWKVTNNIYSAGITINLYETPDYQPTLKTLTSMGFTCSDGNLPNECIRWSLDEPILIKALMQLEPISHLIKADDCIHCG